METLQCPKCGTIIPLTEALTGQIESTLRADLETEYSKKTEELDRHQDQLNQVFLNH